MCLELSRFVLGNGVTVYYVLNALGETVAEFDTLAEAERYMTAND